MMSHKQIFLFIVALLLLFIGYEIAMHHQIIYPVVIYPVVHYFHHFFAHLHYAGEHGKSMYIPVN